MRSEQTFGGREWDSFLREMEKSFLFNLEHFSFYFISRALEQRKRHYPAPNPFFLVK